MEVTKSNFKDSLPIIKKAIRESTFLAYDTELTGLKTVERAFDTVEERYRILSESARKYLIIQFGLSCFKYHPETKKYTHKDFNFYIFPRQHSPQAPDMYFMCQSSSINYLVSHGFDFNKVFYEGIGYLTPDQENRMKQNLEAYHKEKIESFSNDVENQKQQVPKEAKQIPVPDEHERFIYNMEQQVNSFVSNEGEDKLNLPPCSAYRRKLIYEAVLPKFPSGIVMSTAKNDKQESYIVVKKMTDEARLDQMQKKQVADLGDLDDAIGFRKIIDLITESKKLVVGHNMLLDLMHTVDQFYYHLPSSVQEFKEMVKEVFPYIIDTKTLASSPATRDFFTSTALFKLWEDIKLKSFPQPTIEPAENFECYTESCSKEHEAGYDAFITGLCFISLSAKHANNHSCDYIPPESKFLSSFANRPYIMWHFDISSLNLRGPDPEPTRDHVFFVTFPKEWKTVDLVELFSPYGEAHISWINDVSAFVALKTPSQAVNVRRTLLKQTGSLYKVCSYAEYKETMSFKSPSKDHRTSRTANNSGNQEQPSSKRRRSSSGSTDLPITNRSITPIPEEDESTSPDKQDNCVSTSHESSAPVNDQAETPKPKKKKTSHDEAENDVVSSTEKLFEEPNVW